MTIDQAAGQPSTDSPEQHRHRRPLWWLALVLAVAALVVAVVVAVTRQTDDPQVERDAAETTPSAAAPGPPGAVGPDTSAPAGSSAVPDASLNGANPAPTRSPFDNGDTVMAGVDPQALLQRLAARWKLRLYSNPYFGSATRHSGAAGDAASGTRQVTLLVDQEKRLRGVYCGASGPGDRPLTGEGRQFIDDCALGALAVGADRDSLDAWLDRRITAAKAAQPEREEGRVGDYRVVLNHPAGGLVAVELTRPA
ncbi:hypothetical protein [Micromonospora chokoriensis]|uniref:Uncharacterized protein n=1 Tax=Micromonospora chokoriensis TaxID=356851 RepID=A0A1C4VQU0_9ACTN|nr:hypothetical protein [Micromonospora chokoriensis]SCE86099.1 hypothetical protein GA0070612_1680 [Micromonospora chokoriensis]